MAVPRDPIQHRTLRVLFIAQVFSGAGLGAGVAVGALLAKEMIGGTGWAGLPAALFTLGSAVAAYWVGALSQRSGRRPGLAVGFLVGGIGSIGTVLAAALDSVPLLLVALLLYGSGTATNLQARYSGADLAHPDRRGRAISTVLVATTIGAVIGPNLVDVMGDVAERIDIPHLAGPFMLSGAAYLCGALIVVLFLRPDPLLVARTRQPVAEIREVHESPHGPTGDMRTIGLATAVMVIAQLVMLAVMTMTPVHMRDHGHSLGDAGLVISLHIAAMFLPSPLTGVLVDRIGRRVMIACGGVTLCAAGVLAAAAPPETMPGLAVALVLLGLGWNLAVIGGTALLTDAVPLARRARTQGVADVALALAGAAGGLGSGVVVAGSSFAVLSVIGGLIGLGLVPLLLAVRDRPPTPPPASALAPG